MGDLIKAIFCPDSLCEVSLSLELAAYGETALHIRVMVDCGETGFIDVTAENLDKLEAFVAACRARIA